MRLRWLLVALALSALLAALERLAVDHFLYWRYVWFDVPMHYLGGLTVALFLIGFLYVRRVGAFVALLVLVAVGWEVFEYQFGIPRKLNYAFDTSLDLLMDTFGAVSAYALARFTVWR